MSLFSGLDVMGQLSVAFFCTVAAVCAITLGRLIDRRAITALGVLLGIVGSLAMLDLLRRILP